MANKFATNLQVEEDPDFQAWLDAQEVADIRAMEAEQVAALRGVRRLASIPRPTGFLRNLKQDASRS
jgi:hypothetical protein